VHVDVFLKEWGAVSIPNPKYVCPILCKNVYLLGEPLDGTQKDYTNAWNKGGIWTCYNSLFFGAKARIASMPQASGAVRPQLGV